MEYAFSYFSEALNKDLEIVCVLNVYSEDEWDFEITSVFDSEDKELDYESLSMGEKNQIHKKAKNLASEYKEDALDGVESDEFNYE